MTEKIGLDAVFSTDQFQNGMKTYLGGLKVASNSTEISAASMGKSLIAGIGSFAWGAVKLGAIAFAGAVAAGGAALASTIGPASDLNETVSKIGVVFGDASDGVLDFAQNSATSLGMSNNEALGAIGTYGNLFRAMGIGVDTSADMSTSLVGLAADLASFNNQDPNVVLDKLRAGLSGETEPLKSLGVNLSAASIEAKAMEMGLAKVGQELTPAAKAQASYALIMEQTTLAQGDFARTSDGVANQQRIIAAQAENLKAKFGKALLPMVGKVMNAFSKFADSKAFSDFVDKAVSVLSGFVDVAMKVIDALMKGDIKGALTAAFGPTITGQILAISSALQSFGAWISANWAPIAIGIGTVILGLVIPAFIAWAGAAWTAAAGVIAATAPILFPILAIGGAIAVLAVAWNGNWFGMRDTLTAVWEGTLKPAFEQVYNWLAVNIPLAIAAVSNFWTTVLLPAIQAVGTWITTVLVPIFQSIWNWLAINIPLAITAVVGFWNTVLLPALMAVWGWISTNLIPLFQRLATLLTAVVGLAITALTGLWQNVLLPAIQGVAAFLTGTLFPAFQTVADVISTVLQPVMDTAGKFITGTFLPILSKVSDFIGVTLAGAFDGLSKAISYVVGRIDSMIALLATVHLPPWLTPGSPTPFEVGLVGIGDAMKTLTNVRLPRLSAELDINPRQMSPLLATATGSTPAVSNTRVVNNTFNLGGNNLQSGMDSAIFEARVLEIVGRAL